MKLRPARHHSSARTRKIPFPRNGDRSSQRPGSDARLLREKTEHFVLPEQFGWQVGKASDTHTGGIPSGDYEVVARAPRRGDEYEAVFQAQTELVTGMLAIDFEIEKEGMTVPYPPLFNDSRRNHGFVDLRGRPDLAIEIPESSQSPTLKAILVELSEPDSPLFTLGCDLGTHEEPWREESARHVAGGYVQLMCTSYSDRSPEDYTTFGYAIAQVLGEKAQDYNWFVRFVLKLVALSLEDFSGAAPSLWIWFYAIAETPEAALASRESLIGELHRALIDERFTSFFEEERDDGERTHP